MEPATQNLITPRQLRETLKISRTTEWRLVRDGVLTPIRLPSGGRRYASDDAPALIASLRTARVQTPPAPAAA
jgi:hypothetical protein